jgi:uncharacterized membrane protein
VSVAIPLYKGQPCENKHGHMAAFFYVPGNCLIPAYVFGASPSHYVQFPGMNLGSKAAEPLCPWNAISSGGKPSANFIKSESLVEKCTRQGFTVLRTMSTG